MTPANRSDRQRNIGEHTVPVMSLARVLYETMEHLDPSSCGGLPWDQLPDRDAEFYALCVEALIERSSLVSMALTDDNMISRQAKPAEKMNLD